MEVFKTLQRVVSLAVVLVLGDEFVTVWLPFRFSV